MKIKLNEIRELRGFLILLFTQSLSSLGSAATSFALIVWSYQQQGTALTTALLSVCSYLPYVLTSVFAGALCDRVGKKKLMLVCDSLAAACTLGVLLLFMLGSLRVWHLYLLNALNGLLDAFQRPAADVAVSLLVPKRHYQSTGGLRSLCGSLTNMLTPTVAAALLALGGLHWVIAFDLLTFAAAFIALLFFVKLPEPEKCSDHTERFIDAARGGIGYLRENRGILHLILFLAAINLTASMYNAALPALILSKADETALGILNTAAGFAMLIGSTAAAVLPEPRSRVRVICNTLLLSMGTENFILGFGRSLPVWCIGAVLGWIGIPLMNANLDCLMRSLIPIGMQGRVYSARNALQFFTIPVGYFLGGLLVDEVFEPFAAMGQGWITMLFGSGRGSGAAMLFALLGLFGLLTCLIFRRDKHILSLEGEKSEKTQ